MPYTASAPGSKQEAINAVIDEIRKAQCGNKAKYEDQKRAQLAIQELLERHPTDDSPLNEYYCVFCNNYHVGRFPKPKMQRTLRKVMTLENLLRYDFGSNDA